MPSWKDPQVWVKDEKIVKAKLNDVSDNLRYIALPNRKHIYLRGIGAATLTTTSTTPVLLDPDNLTANVELSGNFQVTVKLVGVFTGAALGDVVRVDILMDDSIYLSTITNQPLVRAIWYYRAAAAGVVASSNLDIKFRAGTFSKGWHKFQPVWSSGQGTATFYEGGGYFTYFGVGENL